MGPAGGDPHGPISSSNLSRRTFAGGNVESAFQGWWRAFSSTNDRDVYYASELLQEHVPSMPAEERSAFVVHLTRVVCRQEGVHGAAAPALEYFATEEARRELLACLREVELLDGHVDLVAERPRPVWEGFVRQIAHLSPERLRGTMALARFYLNPEPLAALRSAFEMAGEVDLNARAPRFAQLRCPAQRRRNALL
jgi:hypothetical protein